MEFACSPFVPLGVLAPARPGGSFTATVKLSYDLSEGGWARPTLTPDPIVESAGGPYPRDLLGVKQACDVAIVGWATQEPGPVTFGAGGRVWAKAAARLGAPIDSAHGDPGFAPHDQRIPFPELPLEVTYESQAKRLRAVVPGPPPAIGLVHFSTWHAMRVLPSALDGVLLDPVRAIVILTFRALFSHDGDPDRDLTLVVFPGPEDRRPRVSAMSMWPTFKCPMAFEAGEPRSAPRLSRLDEESTSTGIAIPISRPASNDVLPFARPVAVTAPLARAPAAALPFVQAPSAGAEPPAQTLVDERSDDDVSDTLPPGPDTLPPGPSDTPPDGLPLFAAAPAQVATIAQAYAPAIVAPPIAAAAAPALPPPAPVAPPAYWAAPPEVVAPRAYEPIAAPPPPPVLNHPPAAPLEVAPPPLSAAPVVRGRTEGELSEEEFDAVSADLWTLPDRRREILKDRGLTESSWRAYEERFGGKKAPNVGAIMQSASRRPPIAWRKG